MKPAHWNSWSLMTGKANLAQQFCEIEIVTADDLVSSPLLEQPRRTSSSEEDMGRRTDPFAVRISGTFALFTRPEMKVERVSYDVITPSAASGILEAVLWKPGMRWIVSRILVLAPIRHLACRRNEVASKIPTDFVTWARQNTAREFFADDDRQQRNAVLLRDVDYIVDATIGLSALAGSDDSVRKFEEMFRRRLEKGQHYHQPYLGCREFPATVRLATGAERPHADLMGETDLGLMLHDIVYEQGVPKQPRFFHARMVDGAIDVPLLGGLS